MGYDDDDRGRRWVANIGIVAVVAALVGAGVWYFRSDGATTRQIDLTEALTDPPAAPTSAGPTAEASGSTALPAADEPARTDASAELDAPAGTEADVAQGGPTLPGTGTGPGGDTFPIPGSSTTTDGTTTDGTTTDGTTTDGTTTTTAAAPGPGYPTNPDGTPLPIIAIFDTDTITLTGFVPSEAARQRLGGLAIANSKTPAEVVDNMIVDPDVPISVGVRVIEMNSARFPEGSAEILPAHAVELDRVVTIMNALPNITVLVIGHADQRGSEATNFAISDERARAVVNYLRFLGISPTRLASRAAGESDLLTLDDDEAALALNRRTEFVFYGLLAD